MSHSFFTRVVGRAVYSWQRPLVWALGGVKQQLYLGKDGLHLRQLLNGAVMPSVREVRPGAF